MSYRIGDYKFDTRTEYLAAKKDMDIICSLKTEGFDREDIYASYRRQIYEKGINFNSRVGRDFLQEISRKPGNGDESGTRVYYVVSKRKRMIKLFLMTTLGLFFVIAALILIGWFYGDRRSRDNMSRMQETVNSAVDVETRPAAGERAPADAGRMPAEEGMSEEEGRPEEEGMPTGDGIAGEDASGTAVSGNAGTPSADGSTEPRHMVLPQFGELKEKNGDLAGWLTIPGTEIDYPVMYKAGDNDFYLNHDFDGNNDVNGLLVLDKRCDPETDDPNWLIHGHNMRSGAMFGSLKDYTKEAFYKSHPDIIFSTLYEKNDYRIFAVFRSTVYDEDTTDFQYYDYISIENSEEFYDYVSGAKSQSLYDTGISPEYGDGLLTLSTCDYTKENGRLVIAACTDKRE